MEKKIKFRDLPGVYPEEKKEIDKENPWGYYILRPVSFLVAPLFIKAGFSANQVSALGIFVGIISAALVSFGNYWLVMLGVILFIFWSVLDYVDGNIARHNKTCTLLGKFLEETKDSSTSALFFLSIGIAASRMPGFLPVFLKIPFNWFIIFGLLTALCVLYRHVITAYFCLFFPGQQYNASEIFKKGRVSFLYNLAVQFSGINSIAQLLLVLALMFNLLGAYTIIYFLIQFAVSFANTILRFLKANR